MSDDPEQPTALVRSDIRAVISDPYATLANLGLQRAELEVIAHMAADPAFRATVNAAIDDGTIARLHHELAERELAAARSKGRFVECGGCSVRIPWPSYFCESCTSKQTVIVRPLDTRDVYLSAVKIARRRRKPGGCSESHWENAVAHFENVCALCQERRIDVAMFAVPLDLDGGATDDNLLPACTACNVAKGNRDLFRIVPGTRSCPFAVEYLAKALAWLKASPR